MIGSLLQLYRYSIIYQYLLGRAIYVEALPWDGAYPMEEDDWEWEPGPEEGKGRWVL